MQKSKRKNLSQAEQDVSFWHLLGIKEAMQYLCFQQLFNPFFFFFFTLTGCNPNEHVYLNKLQWWTFILVWTDLNPHTNYLNKIFNLFCFFYRWKLLLVLTISNFRFYYPEGYVGKTTYTACAQPLCNLPTLKNALKSSLAHFWYEVYQQFKNAQLIWKFDSDKSEQNIQFVNQRGTDAY